MKRTEGEIVTRVHGQDLVVAEQAGDELLVLSQNVVVEGPRGEREPRGLAVERGDDFGVAVALVHRAVGAQEVVVPAALDVPHVDAWGPRETRITPASPSQSFALLTLSQDPEIAALNPASSLPLKQHDSFAHISLPHRKWYFIWFRKRAPPTVLPTSHALEHPISLTHALEHPISLTHALEHPISLTHALELLIVVRLLSFSS